MRRLAAGEDKVFVVHAQLDPVDAAIFAPKLSRFRGQLSPARCAVWRATRQGPACGRSGQLKTYSSQLVERCEHAGMPQQRFLPRRGDALIWAADLVHGGSPREQVLTRRSLVTHHCPANRRPPYASSATARPARLHNGHFVLSQT